MSNRRKRTRGDNSFAPLPFLMRLQLIRIKAEGEQFGGEAVGASIAFGRRMYIYARELDHLIGLEDENC